MNRSFYVDFGYSLFLDEFDWLVWVNESGNQHIKVRQKKAAADALLSNLTHIFIYSHIT